MKLLLACLFVLFSLNVVADENQCERLNAENVTAEQLAQRGCCSHHGGVCGCSAGTVMCCDGAASPTCRCHADDVKQLLKSNEAEKPTS